MNASTDRVTFEINWTPAENVEVYGPDEDPIAENAIAEGHGLAGTYRMVRAGVCGPFGTNVPANSREDAEVAALRYGLMRSGEWRVAANGHHYCDAVKIDA